MSFTPIPGFEEYLISRDGEVYSTKVERLLSNQINTNGYEFVRLHKNYKQHSFLISRLLAFVFLDLPSLDSKLEVDHIDTNRSNNHLLNLQVLTRQEHYIKTHGIWNTKKCSSCDCKITAENTSGLCKSCWNKSRTNDGITIEQIVYWVKNHSWVRAGKELGLSDNGVRKRFTKLTGLSPKEIHSYVADRQGS